jgi:hypothetical protein|tara:strand:- start:382 stop:606 length:225 start_codon:yes stop_codon:yes gene_type:complete
MSEMTKRRAKLIQAFMASNQVMDAMWGLIYSVQEQEGVPLEVVEEMEDALTDWAFNSVQLRATLTEIKKEIENA